MTWSRGNFLRNIPQKGDGAMYYQGMKWRRQAHLLLIDQEDGSRLTVELDTGRVCLWDAQRRVQSQAIIIPDPSDQLTAELALAALPAVG
jgi:hypothetical protein